jgi:hypothetical protein
MRAAVWSLEWRIAMRRRRLMAWNVVVPVGLLLPVALGEAAAPHRSAVYAVFLAFFGTFGGCIPLVGERSNGWSEKLVLTGYGVSRWLAERLLATTLIDAVQLAPAVALIFLLSGSGAATAGFVVLAVLHALGVANAIGSLVAGFISSLAEAALASAAVALFALHFSGVFRGATPGSWAWQVERFGPFRPLASAMDSMTSGGVSATLSPAEWLGPLATGAVVVALAVVLAERLTRPEGA